MLSLLLFSLLFVSCKNSATLTERIGDVLEGEEFVRRYAVGRGNGASGVYEEYILAENGKVYKYDFNYDREVFTKQLTQEELNYFLHKIEDLGLEGLSIFEPGNTSSYIEIREGELSINKIVWGSYTYYPPPELVSFHDELFKKLSAWE